MLKKIFILSVIQVLLLLFISQYCLGLEVPVLGKRVNDYANMLSSSTKEHLENILTTLETEESTQLAVLTITSLEGESLEGFSLRVVEAWQLGRDKLDNGALLLIAKNDRKIRIEVGYGLEGVLTDLTAGRIIRNVITPRFKNGDFNQGVIDGVSAMIAAVRGEYKGQGTQQQSRGNQDEITGYLIFILFFLFNIGKIFGRNKIIGATAGSVALPVLTSLFAGFSWPLFLALIPAGFIAGYLASMLLGRTGSRPTRRISRSSKSRNSDIFRGGFGGGSFGGGGGFSGGGGGFGGGGSSGGW
ncbi:YgcG family protein [Desulforhopalus sp. IMCC35007]|uniref:TPM domain-containing protein n=1 Tax=Desulforhopalus sp. IMCC35007 TaxID=2569543 RepID=UPI0010AEDCE9|nr:TPM domain-containing protein [Desulforhopalus sp. IMCC35007]TKB08655.1 hypothetical protein FCL48_13370 [Desulforhopalus sp. IMCC35007]